MLFVTCARSEVSNAKTYLKGKAINQTLCDLPRPDTALEIQKKSNQVKTHHDHLIIGNGLRRFQSTVDSFAIKYEDFFRAFAVGNMW